MGPIGAGPAGAGPGGQQEEPMPSPEELLALFEMMQQQGMAVPPDLKSLVDNVTRQKAGKAGAPAAPEAPTEEITPNPGFVIKTTETKTGQKVFINVCSHDRVAAPGGWKGGVMPDEVAAALEKMQAGGDAPLAPSEVEALRFPLACGPPRADVDRKGEPCTCVDVVFNSDVVAAAGAARRLKAMLIEVATGWVGGKLGGELDPKYKLPKMRYKGEVVAAQRIRADDKRKALVTELRDVDEEPSFALRTTKPKEQPKAETAGAGAGAGAAASSSGSGAAAAPGSAAGPAGGQGGEPAAAAAAGSGAHAEAAGGLFGATGARGGGGGAGCSYKVEYEGRPVQWAVLTVQLPAAPGGAAGGAAPQVEVCGRSVFVRGLGQPGGQQPAELCVPLLFAVSAQGATAEVLPAAGAGEAGVAGAARQAVGDKGRLQLVVRLPYRTLDEHVEDVRQQAPLSFGQLGFASKALLELEP